MNASFFQGNRKRLKESVSAKVIVIAGHDEMQRRADAAYQFTQDANFYYLTGIKEPGWKLVITRDDEFLISPERSDAQTLFDGSLDNDTVTVESGVRRVLTQKDGFKELESLSKRSTSVASVGKDPHQKYYGFTPNSGPTKNWRMLKRQFETVEDIRVELGKLRAIKQTVEIDAIRQAIAATVRGFSRVAKELQVLKNERQVEAILWYEFLNGSEGHAYDPIVAAGAHACTLHYSENSGALPEGELLLIDAGAKQDEYAADITRTYSIGTPTARQKALHAAVEKSHLKIIALLKPGVSIRAYVEQVDKIMIESLKELGLYAKPEDYRRYFPHAISHGLGIDVHDSLGGYKEFQPGMILTVEPGIYIPEEGIGVRIEDDILITKEGHENLSAALPTSL